LERKSITKIPVPANTGLTSASAGNLFKPSGYLLSLAPIYYNTRNKLVKEYIEEGGQVSIITVNLSALEKSIKKVTPN